MKREDFLKTILGTLIFANNTAVFANKKTGNFKTKIRFAIASDGHFGQNGTDYEANFKGRSFVSPSLVIIGKVVALHKQYAWLPNTLTNDHYFKPVDPTINQIKVPIHAGGE